MNRYRIFSFFILFFMACFVQATNVPDLYSVQIPVVDQSQPVRDAAINQGFAIVLIKVSGDGDVLTNARIKNALAQVGDFVQQYSYEQNTDSNTVQQFPYQLNVQYLPTGVNQVLLDAKLQVWGDDRPLIIFWVATNVNGTQALLGTNDTGVIPDAIDKNAQRRGIPIVFPVLDLTDLNQIAVSDVLTPSISQVTQASSRYGSNGIMIVRFIETGTNWQSSWTLVTNNTVLNWAYAGTDINSLVQQGIDKLASALAKQFAFASTSQKQVLTLQINAVTDLNALVRVRNYLQRLSPVDTVTLMRVNKDQVSFTVSVLGDVASLKKAINLDQLLTPVAVPAIDPAMPEAISTLVYQWTP